MINKSLLIEEVARLLQVTEMEIDLDMDLVRHGNFDSLVIVSLIASIDEYYGYLPKGHEIEQCKTLNNIFELISSKTGKSILPISKAS